ncbi:hypothetical protein [Escherichia phage BEBK14]|nr:hypothetical protein [Escherichia phage BEBK14]
MICNKFLPLVFFLFALLAQYRNKSIYTYSFHQARNYPYIYQQSDTATITYHTNNANKK